MGPGGKETFLLRIAVLLGRLSARYARILCRLIASSARAIGRAVRKAGVFVFNQYVSFANWLATQAADIGLFFIGIRWFVFILALEGALIWGGTQYPYLWAVAALFAILMIAGVIHLVREYRDIPQSSAFHTARPPLVMVLRWAIALAPVVMSIWLWRPAIAYLTNTSFGSYVRLHLAQPITTGQSSTPGSTLRQDANNMTPHANSLSASAQDLDTRVQDSLPSDQGATRLSSSNGTPQDNTVPPSSYYVGHSSVYIQPEYQAA